MTREEYKKIKKEVREKIQSLNEYLSKSKQEYIEANREYFDGDKVIVELRKGVQCEAFIKNCNADRFGGDRLVYSLVKTKKDGTMSKIKLHLYDVNRIIGLSKEENETKRNKV